ncbi:MAG TPA: ribonuclease H-like domain-containing protein [Polyangiales bacterium]
MKLREKLGRLRIAPPTPTPPAMPSREPFYEREQSEWNEEPLRPEHPERLDHAQPVDHAQPKLQKIGSLREQLAGLQQRSKPVVPRLPEPRRTFAESVLDAHDRVAVRPQVVPGERTDTSLGPLYQTRVLHDAEHRHGGVEVARGAHVLAGEVAALALDPALAEVDFSRALYIDTETTGLVGGSGTLPFLIGMAWFEGEQLMVEQLLLPRPGHEAPMLARLKERLAQASAIVSYNGKSFDWPLLRTRFVLNRLAVPALPAHLDLLHCARRVYKMRLGSVRLLHLEQEILNYERIDDLPGELIPQRYFEFLRGQADGGTLRPILDHNRSDLVALPALLGELVRRFSLEPGARQHACDQLGFARVAARARESDRAIAHAHAVIDADVRGEHSAHAHFLVGALELKRGDTQAAVAAFERAVEHAEHELDRARAHLALAKLHEHKTKHCARALEHAAHTAACEGHEARDRRVDRLTRRLQRRADPPV